MAAASALAEAVRKQIWSSLKLSLTSLVECIKGGAQIKPELVHSIELELASKPLHEALVNGEDMGLNTLFSGQEELELWDSQIASFTQLRESLHLFYEGLVDTNGKWQPECMASKADSNDFTMSLFSTVMAMSIMSMAEHSQLLGGAPAQDTRLQLPAQCL